VPDTIGAMTPTQPARDGTRAVRAGLVAAVAYALIGWRGLLVPSLIRSVEPFFGRDDAGMGLYFLATALAYGVGSLVGGRLIRGLGPRIVLPLAMVLMGIGLIVQSLTDLWAVFVLFGVMVSLGASTADVGINALVLDQFPHARGRALNLIHVAYSTGALAAPLTLAAVLAAGASWQLPLLCSGVAALVVAAALALTVPGEPVHIETVKDREAGRNRLPTFLLVMALAVCFYVAAEAGVSDWLVRYLAPLPLAAAGTALTLYWGGIAVGRVVFARVGSRVEPLGTAATMATAGGLALAVAILAPIGPYTPLLFGAAGVAFGPVFPLIVAAAGSRMPGRSATVTTTLIFAAVVGATVYPPAIGFLSVAVGLQVAMAGTAVLAVLAGVTTFASRRLGRQAGVLDPIRAR